MSGCDRYRDLMKELLAGEIPESSRRELREHAASCPECRAMMELHGRLTEAAEGLPEPSASALEAMQRDVLHRISVPAGAGGRRGLRWEKWTWPRLQPLAAAAAALVLVAGGFVAGRLTAGRAAFDQDSLVREIRRQASRDRGLESFWDSPFVYSNVSMHRLDDGNLELGFDVARHVSLVAPPGSMVAREVIFQAILDPSTVGLRLKAMAMAEDSLDQRLKEALVLTLENDPQLAVRLRALDILGGHASDPLVEEALLRSLEQDPAVQVRLQALEALARQRVDPGMLRRAIGRANLPGDRAVMQRAVELTGAY